MAIKVFDGGGGSGYSLPTQTGNAGKRLTTDGTNATWQMPGFNLITKTIATGGNVISFTNIPQTYNHLRVIGSGTINGSTEVGIRFNNSMDFNSNYHQYSGSNTVSGSGYSSRLALGNYQNGYGYVFDVNIPNYALSTIKKGAAAFVGGSGGSVGYAICGGGTNANSNPITQLDVYSPNENFLNFIVCLYGWN
jgi:hypothetical protein